MIGCSYRTVHSDPQPTPTHPRILLLLLARATRILDHPTRIVVVLVHRQRKLLLLPTGSLLLLRARVDCWVNWWVPNIVPITTSPSLVPQPFDPRLPRLRCNHHKRLWCNHNHNHNHHILCQRNNHPSYPPTKS